MNIEIKHPRLYRFFMLKFCLIYLLNWAIWATYILYANGAVQNVFATFGILSLVLAFVFGKLETAWIYSYGHGVYDAKKIFDFPRVAFIIIAILLALVGALLVLSFDISRDFPGDRLRKQVACFSLFFGILLAAGRWKFNMYYNAWTASELDLRMKMKAHKWSREEIENRISYLKKEGWIDDKAPYN